MWKMKQNGFIQNVHDICSSTMALSNKNSHKSTALKIDSMLKCWGKRLESSYQWGLKAQLILLTQLNKTSISAAGD
jgi:hypothetical protein